MSILGSSNFSADKMIERPARRAPSRNFPKSVNTRVQLISCGEDPDRQFATFAHDLAPVQYPPSKRDGYKAKLSLARVPRPFSSAVCSEVEPTLCGPTCTIARNADSSSNCVCSSISSSTGAGFGVLTLCESRVADHRTRLGVLLAWSHGTAVAVSAHTCERRCERRRCERRSDSCNTGRVAACSGDTFHRKGRQRANGSARKPPPPRMPGESQTRSGICCAGSSKGIQSRQRTARSARWARVGQYPRI